MYSPSPKRYTIGIKYMKIVLNRSKFLEQGIKTTPLHNLLKRTELVDENKVMVIQAKEIRENTTIKNFDEFLKR